MKAIKARRVVAVQLDQDAIGVMQKCIRGTHTCREGNLSLRGDVRRFDDGFRRRSAGAHNDAGHRVADLAFAQARLFQRLFHGDVIPRGAFAHETACAPVQHFLVVDAGTGGNLTFEAMFGKARIMGDAGTAFVKGVFDFLDIGADGGDRTHAGDHHSPHIIPFVCSRKGLPDLIVAVPPRATGAYKARPASSCSRENRPTRKSFAA